MYSPTENLREQNVAGSGVFCSNGWREGLSVWWRRPKGAQVTAETATSEYTVEHEMPVQSAELRPCRYSVDEE